MPRATTEGRSQVLSRREQRRLQHQDLSRNQLLDAAEEVFGRKGFHETTLKEVAELAEFSVGSVYSFFNGILNSPYAVAKAGVESLGRSLRAELAPLGASCSVAYWGWVDTKMVQDGLARPHSDRIQENTPKWLLKRIEPSEAGEATARGIEERAPRIFAPKWWRYVSALRGIVNPLLDRRIERDPTLRETVMEVEAETEESRTAEAAPK